MTGQPVRCGSSDAAPRHFRNSTRKSTRPERQMLLPWRKPTSFDAFIDARGSAPIAQDGRWGVSDEEPARCRRVQPAGHRRYEGLKPPILFDRLTADLKVCPTHVRLR